MDRVARLPAAERSALFAETAAKMKTPAATSNSSICGQVKFPQREMTGREVFTRWQSLSQAGWRLL